MMNKKNAVFLSDISAARMGVILLQLQETNPGLFDEAIIYHFSLTDHEKKVLESIMPCRFVIYDSPLVKEEVTNLIFQQTDFKRFSPLIFSRFEMFRFLEEFELVMWIDTDVMIQGNISDLLSEARKVGFAIYREDPENKSAFNVDYALTNFNYPIDGYNMKEYLLCSGLIIVSRALEQKKDYTEWLNNKAIELLRKRALKMLDQGTINLLVQEFNIPILPIGNGGKYGCWPYPSRDCSNALIVHAWGPNKFWNDWYLYCAFPKWEYYHQKWISMGGEPLYSEFKPSISVIIPAYKPDIGYLRECIDSILQQKQNDNFYTFSNVQIIIVAEPLNKEEIQAAIDQYNDPRLMLIFNKERMGISYSLNVGLKNAKAEYIARIDTDDIADPQRLIKQYQYLEHNPDISMCVSNYEYFGDMNEGRVIFEGEMSRAWSLLTCPFDHPTVMFRKSFFEQNNLMYDEKLRYAEDWDLWLRAFEKGMTVGCIPETLLYHRWHNGSAGQQEDSNNRMKEIIQENFRKFGVEIPWEYVPAFSPWWGKTWSDEAYRTLEETFNQVLKKNKELKLYDQQALERAFHLRLDEARTGELKELSWKTKGELSGTVSHDTNSGRKSPLKQFIKKHLKAFYRPFRTRYEDRIIEIQVLSRSNNDMVRMCLDKMSAQEKQIHELTNMLAHMAERLDKIQVSQRIHESSVVTKIKDESENIKQILNSKVFEECENTRQMLGGKVFQESEHIRHEILDQVNRHIDFTYRDIMVAIERQMQFLPAIDAKLITDYPIAYESLDHLYPHGTIRDNTRYPRFVEKCEELLGEKEELSFLDLGCSGGGMVLEAALRGHISMGLEGSDCSKKEQRAEWRLLGDRLQTCDITKPFRLERADGSVKKFNIITAWEVMEHIRESDLPQLLLNIKNHLSDHGYFVASIANWEDIDPVSGINWHVTLHEYEWWVQQFEKAGFEIHSDLFEPIDMARGTYNPPHCYEMMYPEYDREKNFYIAVSVAQ